jgi:alkyl hydroperoxide reductase subunit AhpF
MEYLDFARLMDKVVAVEGLQTRAGQEVFQVTTESGASLVARALIVATGARPQMLNIPGERRLLGLGISYSAISHAPFFWGKDTAVVGNDALAMRAAAELATLANRVYLVAAEALPPHSPWLDKLASFDNVTILEGYTVVDVAGAPYLETMIVAAPGGGQQEIAIKGLFVELGLIPNTGLVQELVELDLMGRIVVNCRGETSRPGIYAAGDVTNSYTEQVLIAVGDGAKAALSAYEHLLRRHQPARTRL